MTPEDTDRLDNAAAGLPADPDTAASSSSPPDGTTPVLGNPPCQRKTMVITALTLGITCTVGVVGLGAYAASAPASGTPATPPPCNPNDNDCNPLPIPPLPVIPPLVATLNNATGAAFARCFPDSTLPGGVNTEDFIASVFYQGVLPLYEAGCHAVQSTVDHLTCPPGNITHDVYDHLSAIRSSFLGQLPNLTTHLANGTAYTCNAALTTADLVGAVALLGALHGLGLF